MARSISKGWASRDPSRWLKHDGRSLRAATPRWRPPYSGRFPGGPTGTRSRSRRLACLSRHFFHGSVSWPGHQVGVTRMAMTKTEAAQVTDRPVTLLLINPRRGSDRPTADSRPAGKGQPIVHRPGQILLASDVSFGGLNGGVSQQELNLLQFAASGMAQSRACSSQVVGCQRGDSGTGSTGLYDVPDDILGDPVAPSCSVLSD